eukprot:CAMPEP_0170521366 /NCGR_PEP_ID=MMETSP0209-20121228/6696_1 /TAXON_ID=665100 ORGANISM="Litonotus pictus, Strain P1" /NCGR_SAMPLE_ID=MMETSP0209 /ASSEMBLY_ACC=CAM_ASM_000301 /LENGTH=315 /DNA_ID=CAMNT_0010808173 /DNA_START=154 /DNA_END=1101 /DNA_ORIENTATION=-
MNMNMMNNMGNMNQMQQMQQMNMQYFNNMNMNNNYNSNSNNNNYNSNSNNTHSIYNDLQSIKKLENSTSDLSNFNVNSNINSNFQQQTTSISDNFPAATEDEDKCKPDPRVYDPDYMQGNYTQIMDHFNEDQAPTSKVENYFLALPGKKMIGFNLKVESILIRCPDATIVLCKDKLASNFPIIFDYKSNTIRVVTPTFDENRVLMKDGSSINNGFYVQDFDGNKILLKNREEITSIENYMGEVSRLHIFGDLCEIIVEDGFFDGKHVDIKARGLSKIDLGRSAVKSISKDVQMAKVDDSKISSVLTRSVIVQEVI